MSHRFIRALRPAGSTPAVSPRRGARARGSAIAGLLPGLAAAAIAAFVAGAAGARDAVAIDAPGALAAGARDTLAADSARGRLVYETRCVACHDRSVHARATRTASSCEQVRAQVVRWAQQSGGGWSEEEIDDVVLWLNERYYRFPVKDGRCATPVALLR